MTRRRDIFRPGRSTDPLEWRSSPSTRAQASNATSQRVGGERRDFRPLPRLKDRPRLSDAGALPMEEILVRPGLSEMGGHACENLIDGSAQEVIL